MVINKVLCVYEGIPIWSSAIFDNVEDGVLIGGFLSAFNSFALQTENNSIKNITIGSSFWTIVKIHNLDGFFIAVHADIFPDDKEKRLKILLIEKFILEIVTEFTTQFPADFFKKLTGQVRVFNEIKGYAEKKVVQYNLLLSRYQEGGVGTSTNAGPNPNTFQTEFKCGLCGKTISFQIAHDLTYISKTTHKMFFGAELITYKVGHYDQEDIHINSALVDKKGIFYELIDSYATKARDFFRQQNIVDPKNPIHLLSDKQVPLTNHQFIEKMVILDKIKPWIMEVIGPSSGNSLDLGMQILRKTAEIEPIVPQTTHDKSVILNDKEFHFWNSGSIVVAACFKDDKILDLFNEFATKLSHFTIRGEEWLIKRERLNLVLQIFEKTTAVKEDVPFLLRIITDDLLGIKLKIKYGDGIPRIVDRLGREFVLAKEVLNPLLRGQTTILELLQQNYANRFRELLSLVDFINRRNLLS